MKRYKKGHILFITIAILALLSIMSITFISTSSVERNVSSIAIQNCNAKLAAEAGLEYGISQLRKDFGGSIPITALGTGNWWYRKLNGIDSTNNSETTAEELFDNAATEVRLDSLHRKEDPTTEDEQGDYIPKLAVPSYCTSFDEGKDDEGEKIESGENAQIITPTNISGICGNPDRENFNPSVHFPFTLKIVDTTSQFPLNTHVSQNQMNQLMGLNSPPSTEYDHDAVLIVGEMLNNLSRAVAKRSAWQSAHPNDSKGPLHGLGKEIIRKRNEQKNSAGKCCGFLSKYDIVGTYSNGTITLEDLSYIWDYITVQPTWEEMAVQNIYRQIAPINGTEKQYRIEYRCPVNINTASYPVLMAVLQGISITNGISKNKNTTIEQTITYDKASLIANAIIGIRSGRDVKILKTTKEDDDDLFTNAISFKTWNSFNYFIDVLKQLCKQRSELLNRDFDDKIWDMIKANFNPNVHLKKTNPDLRIYQNITKPELSNYTTEFCFFPLGYFEITSLGEQYDDKGNILSSHHIGTTAHIYNTLYHTSQYDFEGGTSGYQTVLVNKNIQNPSEYVAYNPKNMASRISSDYQKARDKSQPNSYGTGYNAFTLGNNIYKNSCSYKNTINFSDLWTNASKLYGAIAPIGYHLTNATTDTDKSGNTLYTGSKELDTKSNAYVFQEDFSNSNITNAFPDPYSDTGRVDHTSASYLLADGLYLQPGMPVKKYEINEKNFPPIDIDNPLNNEGTILFWFKINSQWNDTSNQFHTVFLSNQVQPIFVPYEVQGKIIIQRKFITIQREIKFQVKIPTEDELKEASKSTTKQFLRKLTIEFTTRVIGDDDALLILKENNYVYKKTQKTVVFDPYLGFHGDQSYHSLGVHAQEWYHLAVRWQDTIKKTTVDDSNSIERYIVLCGNFYADNDGIVTKDNFSKGLIYDKHYFCTRPIRNGKSQPDRMHKFEKEDLTVDILSDELVEPAKIKYPYLNCFFIGSYNEYNTPYMTIADFRISSFENTITDNRYFPTHSPKKKEIVLSDKKENKSSTNSNKVDCHAVYQGRMKLPNNMPTEQKHGNITSYAWTSYSDESLYTYTGKAHNTGINYEKAFNKIFAGGSRTKSFVYENVKNKEIIFETWLYKKIYCNSKGKIDPRYSCTEKWSYCTTVPYSSDIFWYKHSCSLTSAENNVLNEIKSKLPNQLTKYITKSNDKYYYYHYGNYRADNIYKDKNVSDSQFKDEAGGSVLHNSTYGSKNESYPGEYRFFKNSDSYWCYIRYIYAFKFDNIDNLITYYISHWNQENQNLLEIKKEESSQTDALTEMLKDMKVEFIAKSADNDCIALETPYVFTDENDSWVYEIVFPVTKTYYSNTNQVFNNAIVDDVTLFYLLNKHYISDRYSIFTKISK